MTTLRHHAARPCVADAAATDRVDGPSRVVLLFRRGPGCFPRGRAGPVRPSLPTAGGAPRTRPPSPSSSWPGRPARVRQARAARCFPRAAKQDL